MQTREEAVAFGLTFPDTYVDQPFSDLNWTVVRRTRGKKVFLWVFERQGRIWLNLKCQPEWGRFWQSAYDAVRPAYHLNKEHWMSVILDGTVPAEELEAWIAESYRLVGGGPRQNKKE